MNKEKLKISMALGLGIVVLLVLEILLPSMAAVPLAIALSVLGGWVLRPRIERSILTMTVIIFAAFALYFPAMLFLKGVFDRGAPHSFAALTGFFFWVGWAARPSSEPKSLHIVALLWLGFVAITAQAAWFYLGSFEAKFVGAFMVFGAMGFALGSQQAPLMRQLSAVAMLVGVSIYVYSINSINTDAFGYLQDVIIPSLALVSWLLGNLCTRQGWISKIPSAIVGSFILVWIIFFHAHYEEGLYWADPLDRPDLPTFHLTGLAGDTLQNRDLNGQVVWVEFYTAYCNPCVRAMASTEKVAQKFKDDKRVRFMTVSSAFFENHEAFTSAERFLKYDLWHGYEQDSSLALAFATEGVPVGVLVDSKGTVRMEKHGFGNRDAPIFEEKLERQIRELLAE